MSSRLYNLLSQLSVVMAIIAAFLFDDSTDRKWLAWALLVIAAATALGTYFYNRSHSRADSEADDEQIWNTRMRRSANADGLEPGLGLRASSGAAGGAFAGGAIAGPAGAIAGAAVGVAIVVLTSMLTQGNRLSQGAR